MYIKRENVCKGMRAFVSLSRENKAKVKEKKISWGDGIGWGKMRRKNTPKCELGYTLLCLGRGGGWIPV